MAPNGFPYPVPIHHGYIPVDPKLYPYAQKSRGESASAGGAIFARSNATFMHAKLGIRQCTAESQGGGAYIEDSLQIVGEPLNRVSQQQARNDVEFQDCSAEEGGAVWVSWWDLT